MTRTQELHDAVSGLSLSTLPNGWCWSSIGEVGEVRLGRQRSPKNRSTHHPTKYLRAANITWRGLDLSGVLDMEFTPAERETYRLRRGDVLLAEASGSPGEVGKPAIWNDEIEDCCFQNTVIRFRPHATTPQFAHLIFTHYALSGVFARVGKGVGIHHLSAARFARLPFPLPPRDEQQRIAAKAAELLSELDAGAAMLARARKKLNLFRAAILKAAVDGRLSEGWRAEQSPNEPASNVLSRLRDEHRSRWERSQLARYATNRQPPKGWKEKYREPTPPDAENLPALPQGWCWATLGQLLRQELRNGHSAKKSADGTGVRTLTLTSVTEGDFSEKNTKLTVADPARVADLWLEPGDLFVERSNTPELVGTTRLYSGPHHFAIFPDLLIRVRVAEPVHPAFIEAVCQAEHARRFFQRQAKGIAGSMPKIDQATIEALPIPLAPADEQIAIVKLLAEKMATIADTDSVLGTALRRSSNLRRSVLLRAFEGGLMSQDSSDQSSDDPLARIRADHGSMDNGRSTQRIPQRSAKEIAK